MECGYKYLGESARIFGQRLKEPQYPIPVHDDQTKTRHDISIDNFSIEGMENQNLGRTIKNVYLYKG